MIKTVHLGRFFEIAKNVGSWSKDPSRGIGAIIVGKYEQIISQGYNGFPRGIQDTPERLNHRPTKYKYVVHAEANAIYNAIHNGANLEGASIVVTGLPVCSECAKAIIQVGIKYVYMDTKPADTWKESCELALSMFDEVGVNYYFKEDV